jgi:hypothetical protein
MNEDQLCFIQTGCRVEVELVDESGRRELLSFEIVPEDQADFVAGFLGESTPLAKAISGCRIGVRVPYRQDDIIEVVILKVESGSGGPSEDVAARREETLRKAARQSELTSISIYASSMNNKWGDLDPGCLQDKSDDPDNNPPT